MSADNGTYVGAFPIPWNNKDGAEGKEYRICVNGSDSVINELETHFFSPDEYRDAIVSMFGKSEVFTDHEKAWLEAHRLDENDTEYGVTDIEFSVPFGELRAEIPEPKLSEGACPFCSSPGYSETHHGVGNQCDYDPENPLKIAIDALREAGSHGWINEHYIARKIVEALKEKGKL